MTVARLVACLLALAPAVRADRRGRVQDPQGAPVAGAQVTAFAQEGSAAEQVRLAFGRPRPPLGTTRTGVDGAFQVPTGAEAVVDVEILAPGFAPGFTTEPRDGWADVDLRAAPPRRGTLSLGGQPLGGATLVWYGTDGTLLVPTGPDGSFTVPDPDPWVTRVAAVHPSCARGDLVRRRHTLALEADPGVPVAGAVTESGQPVAGAELWADGIPVGISGRDGRFALRVPSRWRVLEARTADGLAIAHRIAGSLTLELALPHRISGVVRDAVTGAPLAGARVSIQAQTTLSDPFGRYAFPRVAAGPYRISATRPGFHLPNQDAIDLRRPAAVERDLAMSPVSFVRGRIVDERGRGLDGAVVWQAEASPLDLYSRSRDWWTEPATVRTQPDGSFALPLPASEDGAASPLTLAALKEGHAAGRATASPPSRPVTITLPRGTALSGKVTASDGTPVASADVQAIEDGTWAEGLPSWVFLRLLGGAGNGWVRTDAAGRFTLRVRPDVVHHLAISAPGFHPRVVQGASAGEDVRVVLAEAAVIAGRVLRADGSPAPHRQVANVASEWGSTVHTTTGDDGSFRLQGLPAGPVSLRISDGEGPTHEETLQAPAADVRIVLEPTGIVRGRVIDARTREPLPRSRVRVPGHEAEIEVAADATFAIETTAGSSFVRASTEGYLSAQVGPFEIPEGGETTDLEIALDPGVALHGRVTTPDGTALSGVHVNCSGAEGAAQTDEEGAYVLEPVAGGEVEVTFYLGGHLPGRVSVDTREATTADAVLSRGLSLSGVVVRDGVGVAGVNVAASSATSDSNSSDSTTDERGRFTLSGLSPARYAVTASGPDGAEARAEDVDVRAAVPLRLVLGAAGTAILKGRVIGCPDAGSERACGVEARSATHDATSLVGADGRFRLEDVPAGAVVVRALTGDLMGPEVQAGRPLYLELTPGTETEIDLELAGEIEISGTITRDGQPVPGTPVAFMQGEATAAQVSTDAEGAYRVAGLSPGRYAVSITGNRGADPEVFVTESQRLDIDLPARAIRGRVVDDAGTGLGGASVRLGGAGTEETATDSGGDFKLTDLADGTYSLVASHAEHGHAVQEVVLSGTDAEVVVELPPAAGLEIRVVDGRDGRPLDASVAVRDGDRRIVARAAGGAMRAPVSSGSYQVAASATGYATSTVDARAPATVRVPLTPGGSVVVVSGRILWGRLHLTAEDGAESASADGGEIRVQGRRSTLEHVAPGRYRALYEDDRTGEAQRGEVVVREGAASTLTLP